MRIINRTEGLVMNAMDKGWSTSAVVGGEAVCSQFSSPCTLNSSSQVLQSPRDILLNK